MFVVQTDAVEPLPDRVETPRLSLRRWTPDDAARLGEAIARSLNHLRPWMWWAAEEPLTLQDRVGVLEGFDRDWQSGGDVVCGAFVDGCVVVGGCGLHRRRGPNTLEIGYWVHADHTRRGYALEMARSLTGVALGVDRIDRVEIHHDRANLASRAVPVRLGFRFAGEVPDGIRAPGEAGVDLTWVMTRSGWTASVHPG